MRRYIVSAAIIAAAFAYSTHKASAEGGLSEPVLKPLVIDHDAGGVVVKYVDAVAKAIATGRQVKVRGNCWSACTLYLALVPMNKLCVYPSASFHFHAPYSIINGEKVLAKPTYQTWFLSQYPNKVHMLLAAQGGLTEDWIHASGPKVLKMLAPLCKD